MDSWAKATFRGETSDLSQPFQPFHLLLKMKAYDVTLQGTKISPTRALLKMIFLSPRWDMLIFMFLFFHQTWVVISKIKFSSRSLGKLSNLTSIFFKGVETTNYSYYVNQEVSAKVSHLFVVLKVTNFAKLALHSWRLAVRTNPGQF